MTSRNLSLIIVRLVGNYKILNMQIALEINIFVFFL